MSQWPTSDVSLQRSPNYEGPASPFENDENWDLPAGESESQKEDEDESEYIIPLLPTVSQDPPDDY
jgi:hypothetical protein